VQLIDDQLPNIAPPPADCSKAADGQLLQSVTSLQANGVLGVGPERYDCGLACQTGQSSGGFDLYYACDASGACAPTAVVPELQVQNPVTFLATDNNGTIVMLPAVPELGASLVTGRLVFGIGTQSNNQLTATTKILRVDNDPSSASYLYLATTVGGIRFPYSYIDSGSNGLFYEDPALSTACASNGPSGGGWYCPPASTARAALIEDAFGASVQVGFSITSADALFSTANVAFGTLGGSAGSANPGAFVWGLPFFFGRPVYTAIWGQALAANGPWFAFEAR